MGKVLKALLLVIIVLLVLSSLSSISLRQVAIPELPPEKPRVTVANVTFRSVSLYVPAVDNEGNGVTTTLTVEEKPGRGGTLVDVNQLLFWVDTQHSIRIAKRVAENYTKLDLSNIDLIYSIETNASVIGGPSAGAALTVATITVLENKTLNPKVMITGTINSDGTIGPVGEIVAKAKAAKDVGATIFLVPGGQAVQTYYMPEEKCQKFGPVTYCTTEYKAKKIDVSKDAGITVKEVSNIDEALKYFLV